MSYDWSWLIITRAGGSLKLVTQLILERGYKAQLWLVEGTRRSTPYTWTPGHLDTWTGWEVKPPFPKKFVTWGLITQSLWHHKTYTPGLLIPLESIVLLLILHTRTVKLRYLMPWLLYQCARPFSPLIPILRGVLTRRSLMLVPEV